MVTADLEIYPGGFPEPMYSTVIKILIKIKIKIKKKEIVKVIFFKYIFHIILYFTDWDLNYRLFKVSAKF